MNPAPTLLIRNLAIILLLIFCRIDCSAQVVLQKFPKENQVLQRNEQDEAILDIQGTVTENWRKSITLIIMKDDSLYYNKKINFSETFNFEFKPILKAGEANYSIRLLLDDNFEIGKASRIVVGDIFLVYGQSNALGNGGIETYFPARNQLVRYYHQIDYTNGGSNWYLPHETFYWPSIGSLELANFLSSKYKYPIGIIEIFVGGAYINSLNNRNASNPADKSTIYGRLLLQADFAGLRNSIKYLIFRQGESDSYSESFSQVYPIEFDKLYKNLNIDFPNLSKIYNFQCNILGNFNNSAGSLREFQRKTKYIYPKVSTISTMGTFGYDGVHYNFQGYRQTAFELSRILGKDIFKDLASNEVYSPDIKKAYWKNNQLVLEFDETMTMVYPKDSVVNGFLYKMSDYIYIDGKNDIVTSGISVGNKIILNVKNFENATLVSYLPSWFSTDEHSFYKGIHISNTLGMRAFSFENIEISGQETIVLPAPTITVSGATELCEGQATTLIAGAGFEKYNWYRNGVPININKSILAINQAGVYTLKTERFGVLTDATNNIAINVYPIPEKPQIGKEELLTNFLLTSSSPTGNQWFLNDKAIIGANNSTFIPQEIGNYSVVVTQNICKNTSDMIAIKIEKPILKLSDTRVICTDDSAKIVAPAGFSRYIFLNGKEETVTTKNELFIKKTGYFSLITQRGAIKSPKSDSIFVKINPIPAKPTISLDGFGLKSSSPTNNQWSVDGKILIDSVRQYLYNIGSGIYSLKIIENGCSSDVAIATITANEISNNTQVKLYPNSNNGLFWIELPTLNKNWEIDISDALGRRIFKKTIKSNSENKIEINMHKKSGSYIMKATSENFTQRIRFVVED